MESRRELELAKQVELLQRLGEVPDGWSLQVEASPLIVPKERENG